MQGQLLIARWDIQLADPLGRCETRGQERIVGKDEAQEGDVRTERVREAASTESWLATSLITLTSFNVQAARMIS
jgi:hypothetical protein